MTRASLLLLASIGGCGGQSPESRPGPDTPTATMQQPQDRVIVVRDTTIPAILEVAGTAQPLLRATLSTRLMGTVTAVLVQEGAHVTAGQLLARIDARDLAAKQAQVQAGIAEAEAVHRDAVTQAARFRALYADSAATRAQLDAAETGLARAEAGVRSAEAAARELDATAAYAGIRAPFAGVVTQRFVDPGAFVAPGAPIATVQDVSRLRIVASIAPDMASSLTPGARLEGTIEHVPVNAIVEGVVPAPSGAVYTVNAIVKNALGKHPAGGAATLRLPQGTRTGLLVPVAALVRQGDLTGVRIQASTGTSLRWVRAGAVTGDQVEILSGLRSGDRVVVTAPGTGEH
jgi:RND family efflux transporter MFP subunit